MAKYFLTGASGHLSSYLIPLLLEEGHEVVGMLRRCSTNQNLWRIKDIINNPGLKLVQGDVTDLSSLISLVSEHRPQFFINTAASSQVHISFKEPIHNFEVTGKGVLNCLEAIRLVDKNIRFAQMSSSEMFGDEGFGNYQNETTPFNPLSPYAVAKLAGYNFTRLYRHAYGMFASNPICFNFESPKRGENFVSKKITMWFANLINKYRGDDVVKKIGKLKLGNIYAMRDWTHAKDTARAVYKIINAEAPNDFVIGSGETRCISEFLCECVKVATKFYHISPKVFESFDFFEKNSSEYCRPIDVPYLKANYAKAIYVLGWAPTIKFSELVKEMIDFDVKFHRGI